MANTKKKSGLGAESYFQNIPSLEPSEDDESSPEGAQAPLEAETVPSEEIGDNNAEKPETTPQAAQEDPTIDESNESSPSDAVAEPIDAAVDAPSTESMMTSESDADRLVQPPSPETSTVEVIVSPPVEESKLEPAEQPQEAEPSTTEFAARTSLIDEDDLAQEPDEGHEDVEEEEPERVKIRRTYALYEETQIALEEMKLANRKKGIKTTLGDLLEEAVHLLMEKKGMKPGT